MKTELYRSFEGKLNIETQSGYIIYEISDYYEIEFVSLGTGATSKFRVSKDMQFDFTDKCKIGELDVGVCDGTIKGQAFYKEKWYSTELINKMQKEHQDYNWRKYI
ncbi:MAG: hypothetical protein ACLRML_02515 [[Ruminococcus] lactaris]